MKIALIHNEYQQRGGEDVVVENEKRLLADAGHEVHLFQADNRQIGSALSQVKTALGVTYSRASRDAFTRWLEEVRPDVVHAHNLFPLLSPSIYDSCLRAKVPVVQTLHNFRITCAGAMLMREGQVCEACITGSAFQGALHGCYRKSRVASLPVAFSIAHHRRRDTWNRKVDLFIALTGFAKSRFMASGIEQSRIVVKPNFTWDPLDGVAEPLSAPKRPRALFVGRLSEEKGLRTLLKAWENVEFDLAIVGDGPLRPELEKSLPSNVQLLGRKSGREVSDEMSRSSFLVLPSEWYEGFPMVLVEAFAHGLPVIASRIGSLSELVEPELSGFHFDPRDTEGLSRLARRLGSESQLMGKLRQGVRSLYLERYSPGVALRDLERVYQIAMKRSVQRFAAAALH